MDARAEGHVPVVGPIQLDHVGMLEGGGIPVGGRKVHQNLVALLHGTAGILDVPGDDPGHGHRGVGPQQLLHGQRHELGLFGQAHLVLGMGGQVP